jgi:hypothetical protein
LRLARRRHPDPVVTRKVGLIRRRGRSLSPAAQQLYDLFGEVKGRRRAGTSDRSRAGPAGGT